MKIEYDKHGIKNIICENWGEFFTEFQKWHAKNEGVIPPEEIHNEEKFDHYVGWDGESYGDFWLWNEKGETRPMPQEIWKNNGEVYSIGTILGAYHKAGAPVNELAVLVLNLSANGSKIRYNDWKLQEEKASKVLREVWATGAAQGTHGLDLDWPIVSQPKQQEKNNKTNSSSSKISFWFWVGGAVIIAFFILWVVCLLWRKSKK
jgi:hypothetical protein